jgi:UDP-N-acetylmuramoyl-tripeptide--D-alanyl-D-alanine ligase
MLNWTMREAAALMSASLLGDGEVPVTGLSIDTRTIRRGDLYVAIRGQRLDGHEFVAEALRKGASGVVADHRVSMSGKPLAIVADTTLALGALGRSRRQEWNGPLVAVTGSVGKTTVKDILAHLLRSKKVLATRGNLNNGYGLPLTLSGLDHSHRCAVVELGINHSGEMAVLADIARPDVAVVTNVGDAHGGHFKGKAQVAFEKLVLLGSLHKNGCAVLNHDDPFLRKATFRGPVLWFGLQGGDVTARDIRLGTDRTFFTLVAGHFRIPTWVPLLGAHHVANALAAMSAALVMGVSWETSTELLKSFKSVSPMRMEVKRLRGVTIINDAYNASPDSMRAALETYAFLPCRGRKVAVLGDMRELGRLAPQAHQKVLEQALLSGVDGLVLVGRDMPSAWSRLFGFVPDLETGVEVVRTSDGSGITVRTSVEASEAGKFLKKFLKPGDMVLLKASRGLELEKALEGIERKLGMWS